MISLYQTGNRIFSISLSLFFKMEVAEITNTNPGIRNPIVGTLNITREYVYFDEVNYIASQESTETLRNLVQLSGKNFLTAGINKTKVTSYIAFRAGVVGALG